MRIAAIVAVVVLASVLMIGGCTVTYSVSVCNQEVDLRNQVQAKQEANKASFDTMFKILQQQAGIVSKYKDDFKDIWPELIEGRYSNGGGKLALWIQERNPTFDSSLYHKLMSAIEAERKVFLRDQQQLIDYKREHDNLRKKFPSGFFLSTFGDDSEIEITVVTSANTKETFRTGEENDIDLFNKKTAEKE